MGLLRCFVSSGLTPDVEVEASPDSKAPRDELCYKPNENSARNICNQLQTKFCLIIGAMQRRGRGLGY